MFVIDVSNLAALHFFIEIYSKIKKLKYINISFLVKNVTIQCLPHFDQEEQCVELIKNDTEPDIILGALAAFNQCNGHIQHTC